MSCQQDRLRCLLPWYVAGTLETHERQQVERHLQACEACAQEYRALVQLRSALKDLESSFPPPPPEVLHRTWTRIVRHEASRSGTRLLARASSAVLGLAAAVLVVLVGLTSRPPTFTTLGTARQQPGSAVQVVFHPWATEAEIRSLLHGVGATIDDGPRPSGLYRLRVAAGRDPHRVVEALRQHRLVVFAEVEP